jgi:hypothetical protein
MPLPKVTFEHLRELVYSEYFETREPAKLSIFDYIEILYNGRRKH